MSHLVSHLILLIRPWTPYRRRMFSIFQDASDNWHAPSILAAIGWLIAGILLFVNLWYAKIDRDRNGAWKVTEAQKETFSNFLRETPGGKVAVEYTATDQLRSNALATILKELLEKG